MKKLAFLLLVALPALVQAQVDNFDDGNADGWQTYNPIGVGSFNVVSNAYRLRTGPSPGQQFGPGRAGAFRPESDYTDFYVAVDIVHWDTNLNQAFGILARVTQIGPGSSDGYAMTWDASGRDLDISIFTNEVPVNVPGQAAGNANLVAGKTYRMVFMGKGALLIGEIYELPNLDTPLTRISAESDRWPNGLAGLIVYDNSNQATPGRTDTTFDNYMALPSEPPRLRLEVLPFGFEEFLVTWSAEFTNYVLQGCTNLGEWSDIQGVIEESGGRRSYLDTWRGDHVRRFYRLRPEP